MVEIKLKLSILFWQVNDDYLNESGWVHYTCEGAPNRLKKKFKIEFW